jgi:hypothetical protein
MRARIVISLFALMAIPHNSGAAQATTAPAKPQSFSERYSIVSDKSIFLRDRSRPRPPPPPRNPPPTAPRLCRRVAHAHRRGPGGHRHPRLRRGLGSPSASSSSPPGDAIARGKITDIDLDAVEYEHNGQRKWITIGSDFTGRAAQIASVTTYAPTQPTTSPSTQAIDPNDPNLTQEQKMKLKRQLELKH